MPKSKGAQKAAKQHNVTPYDKMEEEKFQSSKPESLMVLKKRQAKEKKQAKKEAMEMKKPTGKLKKDDRNRVNKKAKNMLIEMDKRHKKEINELKAIKSDQDMIITESGSGVGLPQDLDFKF
jgi:hypothetical protein